MIHSDKYDCTIASVWLQAPKFDFSNIARRSIDANASIVAVLWQLFLRARRDIAEDDEIRRGFALACADH